MYGFKCYINEEMSMTDLEQAEANLKRLKKIWKEYNKLVDLYGNPRTFTQFVSYIASIIGAEIAEHDSVYGDVGYSKLELASLEYREEKIVNPVKENA